jgi:IS5 family transposase
MRPIISAPSSTKNAEKAPDPEMHQTKKGQQWYFGMKAHIGVSRTKLIHAAVATAAIIADGAMLPDLLHGRETRVWRDQAYRGQRAVIPQHAPACGLLDRLLHASAHSLLDWNTTLYALIYFALVHRLRRATRNV